QALHYFSRVQGQATTDAGLSLMVAKAQLKTGQTALAVQTLKGLVGRPGLTNAQLFGLAWLLGQARLNQESIRVFNQLPPAFPNAFSHDYGLALAYFGNGQYDRSIATLTSLLKQGNTSAETYSLLGVAEEKAGHTKEAYDAFRQGILKNPKDPRNYLDIATLSCQHLNYDLAVQILTSGSEFIPGSHELVLSRGIAHTLKGQFKEAAKDYERSIQMDPQDSGNYVALGLSKLEWGDLDGAIRAMQKASELQPKDPRPYYFQTEALLQKGVAPGTPGFEQARRAIDMALSLDPDEANAQADQARLELLSNHPAAAVTDLERAHAENPHSKSIAYLLAQAYRRNGQKEKAAALFAQVREVSEQ
ncbi:MAG: tetratricopeptide repeat protein, partial [Candidatus Dormibacteraceae bacterium]